MFTSATRAITVTLLWSIPLGELLAQCRHFLAAAPQDLVDLWWVLPLRSTLADSAILLIQFRLLFAVIRLGNGDLFRGKDRNPPHDFRSGAAILKIRHKVLNGDAAGR